MSTPRALLAIFAVFLIAAPAGAQPASPTACTTIPGLQGAGLNSPCQGHRDTIAGCIIGVTASGFFFQDLAGDGDPATSDGIYAYYDPDWTNPAGLKPGDQVSVSGTVTEFYGTTEFAHGSADPLQVTVTGSCSLPPSATVRPYLDPLADPQALYEHFESMRVQMTFDGWVVGPTMRYASRYPAGDPELACVDYGSTIPESRRVFERDYPGYQGITYLSGALGADLPDADFGDRLTGNTVSGVLSYQYGEYALLAEGQERISRQDDLDPVPFPRPVPWDSRSFDVCFLNTNNLFDYVNDGHGDWGDWAPGWPTSGSLAGEVAYDTRLKALAKALDKHLSACMVIGLEEVEGKQAIWNDLAAWLNATDSMHMWSGHYVETGDPRDISQGFLIRDDVQLLAPVTGVFGAPYTGGVADGVLDFVRVPASASVRFNPHGLQPTDVTLIALHFKSNASSSACATDDCTDRRDREALDLRDILFHLPPDYVLPGGAEVRARSGPAAPPRNRAGDPRWSTGYIRNNDGYTAELREPGGQVVDSWCYKAGCP